MACAASFCVTTSPKRDATWVMKRTRIGPPSSTTPRSTTKRAACVTLFASMPRTAKYPLSEASAEPGRPPNANTCTHESAASGSDRSSPWPRAISAIDLSMMMVESGSSMGSDARPKAPPTAPEAVANALCKRRDPARGAWCRLRSATSSAISSALVVAAVIACEAEAGSAYPISSIGLPTIFVSPRGKPGMFERGNGAPQRRQVALGHACRSEHRLHSSSARKPGVVRRRGGDAAERRLRHAINPEGEQPRRGDAQQYRPMGLVLNNAAFEFHRRSSRGCIFEESQITELLGSEPVRLVIPPGKVK